MTQTLWATGWILLLSVLWGCGETPSPPSPRPGSKAAQTLPAGLFVETMPEGARSVAALKRSAKAGEVVVVHGRVGGEAHPFVKGAAVMLVAQHDTLTACNTMQMDPPCPSPWDFCCDPPKKRLAHTLTVRVVGPDGRPLRVGLEGQGGLRGLTQVVIEGKVAQRPNSQVLMIDATRIHISKRN